MVFFNRRLNVSEAYKKSIFLFGPRQTGKTYLLKQQFPQSPYYDRLQAQTFFNLTRRLSLFREECIVHCSEHKLPIIVDEIQKLPLLLDEVQSLIETHRASFVLTGSSPRKLKRSGANLLGGRARTRYLFPGVYPEIPDFNLMRVINSGALPFVYNSDKPEDDLVAYCGSYLEEEIMAEGLARRVDCFSRFLQVAALNNAELVNLESLARDTGVSPKTVRAYFSILEDSLIGSLLAPYKKTIHRKAVSTVKFYFFDVGVANCLAGRRLIEPKTELFGKAFEHFIYSELRAYLSYNSDRRPLCFWRDRYGQEVDFVIGDDVALEVKATDQVIEKHLKGIKAFTEEIPCKHRIVVSTDQQPRIINDILILPWEEFLRRLWAGNFAPEPSRVIQ